MGFSGKQIIHPLQVDIVQNAYSPNAGQLAYAIKVVAAHYKHSAEVGGGGGG